MEWKQLSFTSVITLIIVWFAPYLKAYLTKKGENLATHEDLDKLTRALENIKSEFVEANAYASEKGKGLATKEDIGEITRTVENVRHEVSTSIELLKWQLGKRATIHRLASEKEFEALGEIGKALFELQLTTTGLRPSFDRIDPNEPEQERHNRRYAAWAKSHDTFLDVVERHKLFMSQSLYLKFFNIRRLSHAEALDFEYSLKAGKGKLSYESYQRSKEKLEAMDTAIREAIESIRRRCGIEE
jgi:hypothetical protein